ncbi:hypothetical protein [Dactylococcopsis salina]|nr:hypothetical protein [Dactylococcopsis salina]
MPIFLFSLYSFLNDWSLVTGHWESRSEKREFRSEFKCLFFSFLSTRFLMTGHWSLVTENQEVRRENLEVSLNAYFSLFSLLVS